VLDVSLGCMLPNMLQQHNALAFLKMCLKWFGLNFNSNDIRVIWFETKFDKTKTRGSDLNVSVQSLTFKSTSAFWSLMMWILLPSISMKCSR
jgi:hypothetical protein